MDTTNIPAPRVPFIDTRTGLMAREWYRFLVNLFTLTGSGQSGTTITDLAVQSSFDTTGTVRYVNATSPSGVLAVGGVPYQNNGTITHTWAGTSGGIPYFSSASALASSAALTAKAVILGGGAGTAPYTISVGANNQFLAGNTGSDPAFRALVAASADLVNQGTTTTVLHGNAAGNPAWAAVSLAADVTGNLPVAHLNGGSGAGATTYWRGDATWVNPLSGGISTVITTAALTGGGTTGTMTFVNGLLTASTPAT